jgi:Rrf2 family protein
VRSTDISRRQGIPRRYLEQVLQELVRKGILSGQRGPRGGYRLARERRRISVGEIVRVVRVLEGANDPANEPNGSEIGVKVVRPIWSKMQDELMERFDALTIEELCNRARTERIASEAAQVPDFSI